MRLSDMRIREVHEAPFQTVPSGPSTFDTSSSIDQSPHEAKLLFLPSKYSWLTQWPDDALFLLFTDRQTLHGTNFKVHCTVSIMKIFL